MILVIDNYDSFTYNLVQYLGEMGNKLCIVRNDKITLDEIRAMRPAQIVISPGPGTPDDGGVSLDVIRELGGPRLFSACASATNRLGRPTAVWSNGRAS
jgi:anthranilate synthase component 2